MLNHWKIVRDIGLLLGDPVSVEVKLQDLSLLEAEQDACGVSQECEHWIEEGIGDLSARVADASSQLMPKTLLAPGGDQ